MSTNKCDKIKRDRAINFTSEECRLLTELVEKYKDILENKKTDAVTNNMKETTWNKISTAFNASGAVVQRSAKSLKLKYEGIKKATKKKMSLYRQEMYKTGGGPSAAPGLSDIEEKVLGICSNITGLEARNDSDHISEHSPSIEIEVLIPENQEEYSVLQPSPEFTNNITNITESFVPHEEINKLTDQEDIGIIPSNTIIENELEKENQWSSWNPKALKNKTNKLLKKTITKEGVTAKLDKLSTARLELVELQKEIARKEHAFIEEEHKLKMLHLENEEKRKQE